MSTLMKQQRVGLTTELLELIQVRVKQLGISSIPEYFRHLALSDIKVLVDESPPLVDEETEESIGRALMDIKKGRTTSLKTDEEIKNHLRKLVDLHGQARGTTNKPLYKK